MNKQTVYKYVLAALVLVSMMAVGILFVAETEAENPASVIVTLFKTELKASAAGTPAEVFNNAGGSVVDLVKDVSKAFGQGAVEAGTYNMIVFTVENEITFTEDIPYCNGSTPQTVTMLIDPGQAATEPVPLYFATPSAGGKSGWVANGSADYPFMMLNPVEVVADQTTAVEIMFQTAGTVSCNSGVAELSPPSIAVSYVIVEETEACSPAGTYWFYHYAMRGNIYNSDGVAVNTNSLGEMIQNSEVVSGWGTMMINTPTLGEGTWGIYSTNPYDAVTKPGMAEHRHQLSYFTNTAAGRLNEGYLNPIEIGPADTLMGGTYKLSGQRMIFYMPEGGFFEGAINQTCEIFAGVSLTGGDNDLIYAVRKGDFSAHGGEVTAAFPNMTMVMVQPQLELTYEDSIGDGIVNTNYMYFGTDFAVLSTGEDRFVGWRSSNQMQPAWGGSDWDYSSWQATRPEERSETQDGVFSMITLGDDGQLLMPDNDSLVAFGKSGMGIIAGSTQEFDSRWGSHRHSAGVILPIHANPDLTDLEGTWSLSMLGSEVKNTTDWDTPDNVDLNFTVEYGDITVKKTGAGIGNGVANFFGINALTGQVSNSPGGDFIIYGPVTECYDDPALSPTGLDIYATPCTAPAIAVPVFLINGVDELGVEESPGPSVKIALDSAKGAIALWSPADLSGTIYNTPTSDDSICAWNSATVGDGFKDCPIGSCDGAVTDITDEDWCDPGDPATRSTFGIGIKIQ